MLSRLSQAINLLVTDWKTDPKQLLVMSIYWQRNSGRLLCDILPSIKTLCILFIIIKANNFSLRSLIFDVKMTFVIM